MRDSSRTRQKTAGGGGECQHAPHRSRDVCRVSSKDVLAPVERVRSRPRPRKEAPSWALAGVGGGIYIHRSSGTQKGPRSSRMPKPPLGGWPRSSPAPALARCTRSRLGSTSRCCAGPCRTSPSRSAGARRTRESRKREGRQMGQKLAAEEPDARGVEWLSYSDRTGARAMPLSRSLARLERAITEK